MGKKRFLSLDVFRGATVCLMILVNNPGSWSAIFPPFRHASWHGLTPTDLVFPFFLFAVGNAMAFVIPKFREGREREFWMKITKRSILIFLIGLFLNWYPFLRWTEGSLSFISWSNGDSGVRILGVLQRIAIAYFFSSIIVYYTSLKRSLLIACFILLAYWLIVYLGNPADPYSLTGFMGTGIDKAILGVSHMYKGEGIPFDPEGLLSTIPTISQVIFGYLAGMLIIRNKERLPYVLNKLFVYACWSLLAAYVWSLFFPINKKIWSSSYVLATTGLGMACIALMIYFIEVKDKKNLVTRFFEVYGKNPLFIFALSAFLPKTARLFPIEEGINPWNIFYRRVLIHIPGPAEVGSLAWALCVIIFMGLLAYWMDKRKIYIKV